MRNDIRPITSGRALRYWNADWFAITESLHRPGQRIPLHAHTNADFTIVSSGGFDTGRCDRRHACGPMQVLFLPGGYEHSDRFADHPTRSLIIELREPRWESLGRRCRPPDTSCLLNSPLLCRTASTLVHALGPLEPGAAQPGLCVAQTVEELILDLLAALIRHDETPSRFGRPRWLTEAIELIRQSFLSHVGLALLADRAGVHPIHFARVFRSHVGCSVGQYVQCLRVDHAAYVLSASNRAIGRIAAESGFYDQAQFSRLFKRRMGVSPARYRREFHGTRAD